MFYITLKTYRREIMRTFIYTILAISIHFSLCGMQPQSLQKHGWSEQFNTPKWWQQVEQYKSLSENS